MGKRKAEDGGPEGAPAPKKPSKPRVDGGPEGAPAPKKPSKPRVARAKAQPQSGQQQRPAAAAAAAAAAEEQEDAEAAGATAAQIQAEYELELERQREVYMQRREEDSERMRALWSNFTPDQLDRFEKFKCSSLGSKPVGEIAEKTTGFPASTEMKAVLAGLAKLFVGELVESGRALMAEREETGPLRAWHLREALRRMRSAGRAVGAGNVKRPLGATTRKMRP